MNGITCRHSLIRGVYILYCTAIAKNYTNYVFCHPKFSGVIQNIEKGNRTFAFWLFLKFCFNGTMIFGTLAWTIVLYMTKYIIGVIFSSGGATLYKNPSDQTVRGSSKYIFPFHHYSWRWTRTDWLDTSKCRGRHDVFGL